MTDQYANAEALRKAITDRARSAALVDPSTSMDKRLRQFAYGRFLTRIFGGADRDEWVLKGGVALLARLPQARHSQDIDLARQGTPTENLVDELERVMEQDGDDFFEFRLGRSTRALTGAHQGISIPVIAYLGIKEFTRFNVDVVTGVSITVEPDLIEPSPTISVPGIAEVPWRTYPLVDHIADKFAAMSETHGNTQRVSSRYRDLVDIVLIATSTRFESKFLRTAILSEFRFRRLTPTAPFTVPDADDWRNGYEVIVKNVAIDVDFDSACTIAADLFSITSTSTEPSAWNPNTLSWEDSG